MPAISWCASMGIAISVVASDSALLLSDPDAPHDGPVKRAQGVRAVTDDALVFARYLLTKKMDSEIAAIERDFGRLWIGSEPSRKTALAQIRPCIESLAHAETLVKS